MGPADPEGWGKTPCLTAPRYHLTLEAQPEAVPAVIRLRRLLKVALRGFGLKCVAVAEVAGEDNRSPGGAMDSDHGD